MVAGALGPRNRVPAWLSILLLVASVVGMAATYIDGVFKPIVDPKVISRCVEFDGTVEKFRAFKTKFESAMGMVGIDNYLENAANARLESHCGLTNHTTEEITKASKAVSFFLDQ